MYVFIAFVEKLGSWKLVQCILWNWCKMRERFGTTSLNNWQSTTRSVKPDLANHTFFKFSIIFFIMYVVSICSGLISASYANNFWSCTIFLVAPFFATHI